MTGSYKKLAKLFYERDPLTVTRELLGKYIVREAGNEKIVGKIVEAEAYIGPHDRGSHAYNNKKSKRTKVQYQERGLAYIFTIYGKNVCFCIVIGRDYEPAVALVRAIEPIKGIESMRENRKTKDIKNLTNGPSKFCQAFNITMKDYGIDLCGDNLFLTKGEFTDETKILCGPRINIDYAEKWKNKEWRFYINGNEFVSK
jgi:DNA-3-methyladenine glycosylase